MSLQTRPNAKPICTDLLTATLKGKSAELLVRPPVIEKVDVMAAKLADFG